MCGADVCKEGRGGKDGSEAALVKGREYDEDEADNGVEMRAVVEVEVGVEEEDDERGW